MQEETSLVFEYGDYLHRGHGFGDQGNAIRIPRGGADVPDCGHSCDFMVRGLDLRHDVVRVQGGGMVALRPGLKRVEC